MNNRLPEIWHSYIFFFGLSCWTFVSTCSQDPRNGEISQTIFVYRFLFHRLVLLPLLAARIMLDWDWFHPPTDPASLKGYTTRESLSWSISEARPSLWCSCVLIDLTEFAELKAVKVTQMAQAAGGGRQKVGVGGGTESDVEKSVSLGGSDNADRIYETNLNLKITDDHFFRHTRSLLSLTCYLRRWRKSSLPHKVVDSEKTYQMGIFLTQGPVQVNQTDFLNVQCLKWPIDGTVPITLYNIFRLRKHPLGLQFYPADFQQRYIQHLSLWAWLLHMFDPSSSRFNVFICHFFVKIESVFCGTSV